MLWLLRFFIRQLFYSLADLAAAADREERQRERALERAFSAANRTPTRWVGR